MEKLKPIPAECPSCRTDLEVTELRCSHCETEVRGSYQLPPISRLEPVEQDFILNFVKTSGSLKEMAKLLGVSYPTVRNRLNEIIRKLEPEIETPNKEKV